MIFVNGTSDNDIATLRRESWTRPAFKVSNLRRRVAARLRLREKFQRRANRHGPELEPAVIILGLIYGAAILTMIARLAA